MPDNSILNRHKMDIEEAAINVQDFRDHNLDWEVFLDFLLVYR